MPSTNLNLNTGNRATFRKSTGGENWFMLLAIVLAGAAATWLGYQWYSYEDNKQWLNQNWHELKLHISSHTDKTEQPVNKTVVETKTTVAETPQQPNLNTDFVAFNSISPTNIKAWRQAMQSIDDLNKQAAAAVGQPSYHNHLGILYAQVGDFKIAIKQFNQAIDLCRGQIQRETKQANNPTNLYIELTCAHSNLAKIYDRLGEHSRVIAELEELNADLGYSKEASLHRYETTQKSFVSYQINQPGYNVSLTPEQAALFAKAEALRQVGQLPESMQAYTELIKEVPNFALAHQRLGVAAAASNNLGLAVNELLTALTLDSRDPDTYNDLGLVYRQLGDYPAAKKAFGRAHDIDPKHLSASMNYADSLALVGNFPSALHIMQQAVIYHPDSSAAHNDLASLYGRTGNDKAAAKEFAQTLNLNSGLASAHYGLGLASLNLKSYPQAISELETAQKLSPGILDLQNKLDLANRCNSKELASATAQGVGD